MDSSDLFLAYRAERQFRSFLADADKNTPLHMSSEHWHELAVACFMTGRPFVEHELRTRMEDAGFPADCIAESLRGLREEAGFQPAA